MSITIPSLQVYRSRDPVRPSDLGHPRTAIIEWRGKSGAVIGRGAVHERGSWIELLRVGHYVSLDGQDVVLGTPAAGVLENGFSDAFARSVLPLFLQLIGLQSLHASGILTGAGVVAICGVSGAGKSTTAASLGRLGYEQWGDDVVAVDMEGERIVSRRLPFAPRLDSVAQEIVASILPTRDGTQSGGRSELPLAGVIIQEQSDVDEPVLELLPGEAAFRETIRHAYCFSLHEFEARRAFTQTYLAAADATTTARLRYRPGLRHVRPVMDVVCRHVEELERANGQFVTSDVACVRT